jgi:hypothetical protein
MCLTLYTHISADRSARVEPVESKGGLKAEIEIDEVRCWVALILAVVL